MANVVLVDDEGANFQVQEDEEPLVRFCEVTRYEDDDFRDQGMVTHMGGLGAKRSEDYVELQNFVEKPWLYREVQPPLCFNILSGDASGDDQQPVQLQRRHTEDELELDKLSTPGKRHIGVLSP